MTAGTTARRCTACVACKYWPGLVQVAILLLLLLLYRGSSDTRT